MWQMLQVPWRSASGKLVIGAGKGPGHSPMLVGESMKIRWFLAAGAAYLCLGTAVRADNTVQALMREKLESAHGILDGLAMEDFTKIAAKAEVLRNISRVTTWYKPDAPDFQHYAKSFQNSAEFLMAQAKAHNLEGVAMGYIRVTLDCMQCHNAVRAGRNPKK